MLAATVALGQVTVWWPGSSQHPEYKKAEQHCDRCLNGLMVCRPKTVAQYPQPDSVQADCSSYESELAH